MKRLRRRKSSDNAHGSSVNPEIHSVPEDEAQLYARFSAAHRSHDPSRSSKPIVSGPMALTAKPMSPSVVGRGAIPERGIVHIPNRNEQPPKVLASPPSRKSSRAALLSAVQEYTHAHPSHPKPLSAISADPASEYDLSHLPQTIPTATRPPSPPVPVRIDLGRRHHAQYDIQPISANHEPPAVVPSRKPSRHPPLSQDNLQETKAQATKERHRVYVPAPAQQVSTYNDDEEYDPFKAIPTIVKPPPPQNGRNCLPTASQEPVVQDNSAPAGLPDTSEKQLPLPPEPILTRHSPPITGPTLTPARSLLNAPSLVRKKYSPLAAFGLPTAQTTSTPPVASQSSGTLPQQQPHDAPQAPIDIGGISSPDQSSVSHSKSTPNDTTPLPISYQTSFSASLEPSDVRSGGTSAIDMRSYNDVPIDSMHEPHSRVKRRSKQYASEDSPLKPSRHISATPKSSLRELEESVETTTALPTSEDSSRFQSSSHPTPNSHDPTPEDSQISSSSSSNMPARSINLPYPGLSFGSRKQSRKVESRPPESYPEAQPPTNHMQPPTPATPRSGPHRKGPPVRGRPLIFAAMAANPQVAEIVDDISALAQEETVEQIPDEGVPSSFNDQAPTKEPYPSPKSPDVELPQPRQVPNQPELEPPRRRRKLAKVNRAISRKEGVATHGEADSSRAKDTSAHHSVGPSQNLLAGHRHHDDRPRTPVNLAQELTSLGSPIQLQEETREGMHHRRSRSDDYAKLLKRNRDKVKALTEKQLEKLGRRNSNDHAYEQEVEPIAQPLPFPATRPLPAPPTQLPTPPSRSPVPHGPDPSAPSHPQAPPTPPAEDFAYTRTRCQTYPLERSSSQVGERLRSDHFDEELQAPPPPPTYYPILEHVNEPVLLANILCYLSYFEWCTLAVVSKEIRTVMYTRRELTELILERYLRTVGYDRWSWKHRDPLLLTLDDLTAYMRGVSLPSHQYARVADAYLQPNSTVDPTTMRDLATSCRAFTRVVLRLRAQAEAEAEHNARIAASAPPRSQNGSPNDGTRPSATKMSNAQSKGNMSRPSSSRAPSPTTSMFSHSHSHAHGIQPVQRPVPVNTFRSPLFRPRRAPLLQVFVPSPEGNWLSDTSVLQCEAELKRAGVSRLLRAGDVIWDIAVGDEGNVGRMVWDGSYLIDLDYTWSRAGDLPRYLPALAFPPSYFHRVIRTMGSGNPIVHMDIAPWSEQIASNLQLLTDRMRTETPQGGQHTVVRWVNRSTFTIRPTSGTKYIRIPVPKSAGPGPSPSGAWVIDPGWYGTVVVETEGTNEGLADLQERCKGAFPPRAVGADPYGNLERTRKEDKRTVFRIIREKSRPGEIWLRTVREKERLLPG